MKAFAAAPARSHTLPRASRATHSKTPLTSSFSEKVQITAATRLINNDVPQEVVRRLLDHTSHTMTARYARLADTTIREQWERAQKINIRGEPIDASTDGPLADAAWMKQNLSRAKMALPNGYCGLPLQKSCPHTNAPLTELTCPTAWRDAA